jgi:hypothetical protein
VFITWVVSNREVIRQFLELAFQMTFMGPIGIRHGGSKESVDAVQRAYQAYPHRGIDIFRVGHTPPALRVDIQLKQVSRIKTGETSE